MAKMGKIARGGDPTSVTQSHIARGGNQKPQGNLADKAIKGGDIPMNPNASKDPKGVGTH